MASVVVMILHDRKFCSYYSIFTPSRVKKTRVISIMINIARKQNGRTINWYRLYIVEANKQLHDLAKMKDTKPQTNLAIM